MVPVCIHYMQLKNIGQSLLTSLVYILLFGQAKSVFLDDQMNQSKEQHAEYSYILRLRSASTQQQQLNYLSIDLFYR